MEMTITMPGDGRVDASWRDLSLTTEQDGSAPAPFELFLASIGTCVGIYVARFCQHRGIPTEGIRILQRHVVDRESGHVDRIVLDVALPPEFPEKYREAVIRTAMRCKVKEHLAAPPVVEVTTSTPEPQGAR